MKEGETKICESIIFRKKSILGGTIMQLVKTKNVKSIVETLEASISDFMNSQEPMTKVTGLCLTSSGFTNE